MALARIKRWPAVAVTLRAFRPTLAPHLGCGITPVPTAACLALVFLKHLGFNVLKSKCQVKALINTVNLFSEIVTSLPDFPKSANEWAMKGSFGECFVSQLVRFLL